MRVLVVDDQDEIRRVARVSLESIGGFETTVAAGPFEALAAVKAQRPDLILMDVMMPGMDGVATFQELRRNPEFSDIPVVFLTAKARRSEVEEYTRMGAAGVITKPFDPMTLPADLHRVLREDAARSRPPSTSSPSASRPTLLDPEAAESLDSLVYFATIVAAVSIGVVTRVESGHHSIVSAIGIDRESHPPILDLVARVLKAPVSVELADVARPDATDEVDANAVDLELGCFSGIRLRDASGSIVGTLSVGGRQARSFDERQIRLLRDIAERVAHLLSSRPLDSARQAAERAAASGTREFVVAVEACPTGMLMADATGTILLVNSALNRLLGYSSDEVLGQHVSAILPPALATLIQTDTLLPTGPEEHYIRRRDGSEIPVEVGLTGVASCGTRRTLVSAIDITPRREMESIRERLARQERLVTTGTLAAGVGHEINNPLTYILGNAEFALEELLDIAGASPSARMRELLDLICGIREGAERIRKIVRGLRAFARADSVVMPIDVHASLEMSINMAAHELRQRATLVTDLEPVPPVLADEAGLSQVLVNLLVNAAQAFLLNAPESNVIRVRTGMAGDGRVLIEVSDNGPGIAADVLPRIFDPFFTTKPVGKGTGLGLAICHNVVAGFGGTLTCDSQVCEGAVFRLLLPRAIPVDDGIASAIAPVNVERLRILVVDDEAVIAKLAARILKTHHDVTFESDPRVALRRLLSEREHFDVILCDLMMPYLTGMELYRVVSNARPEVGARFAFMSGGAMHVETQVFLAEVPNERLDKPFSGEDLRALVRRLSIGLSLEGPTPTERAAPRL